MGKFFTSRPIFSISLALVTVITGLLAISSLPVEQYPDITPRVVEITAVYPGADAVTTNNAVANPIAQSIMGTDHLLYVQTTSSNTGEMTLQATFDISTDPDMNSIFCQNNVAAVTPMLPAAVVQQGITTKKSMPGFLMVYTLNSDGRYDDDFLSNYAYINLQNELLKIDGIGKVSVMGAGEYAMRIWLKPDLMKYYGISTEEMHNAIESQGGTFPSGQLGAAPSDESVCYTYTVTMPRQLSTAEEFTDIVLRSESNGEILRLGDVAEVELGSSSYGVESRFGEFPSTLLVIYQQNGSNALQLGHRVRQTMDRLARHFPDGVSCTPIVDTTQSIKAGIKDIFVTLLTALLLVIVILYLFIQEWRATLIPLIAIPVSLVGAFLLFPLAGLSVNIISLLALVLAIGLVVDDAIVVVEAVQSNMDEGMDATTATLAAMKSVSPPIIATTVVLLAVFLPVSFLGGIAGELFRQFSLTISFAIVISAFNALTLSPALCALLLRQGKTEKRRFFLRFNHMFQRRKECYARAVEHTVTRRRTVVAFLLITACACVLLLKFLPRGFLPEEDQGYVMVSVSTKAAASLNVTKAAMARADSVILATPDIVATSYAAGFDMLSGIASPNSGIIFVSLADYSHRKRSAMQIAELLNRELYAEVPEALCYSFIPPSIPGLGVSAGISAEIEDLQGQGAGYLWGQCSRFIDSLETRGKIAAVNTQFSASVPQRHLDIDKHRAMMAGVDLGELYGQLSAQLGGEYINNFSRFGKLYRTYMQAAPFYRTDNRSLEEYFITAKNGKSIPLSSLMTVRDTTGANFISSFNLYNAINLMITPRKGTSTAEAMLAVRQTAEEVLPEEVGLAWSGVSYQEQTAGSSLPVYLSALFFVYLALAALYESWRLPVAILLGVIVAVTGAVGLLSLWHLFDKSFINDIFLQISLVLMMGLSAKNAILVVEYAESIHRAGKSTREAAREAAVLRLRPIIMTAFAFLLGVMPLVFADGVYSTARNIMGVALVGGMLFSTFIGIFLYPALYYLVSRDKPAKNKQ